MTKDEQKEKEELTVFNVFRRLSPELGLSEGTSRKPPAADILASVGSDRIGIEITRILRQDEKRRENEEFKVIEAARQKYELLSLPAVGVSAHWVQKEPSPRERDLLAKSIANFIAQSIPPRGKWVSYEWTTLPDPLSEYFHHLRIERFLDYTENFWTIPRAGWVAPLDSPQIQSEIAGKEPNVPKYRSGCDRVWLLLVLEGDPSSLCALSENARTCRYTTSFDRVFLLGAAPREVIELVVSST